MTTAIAASTDAQINPETIIDDVFGPTGFLSKSFPGYQPRESQVKLSAAIARAIRSERHILAEGPTGTGKSVAYLTPAIALAVHERQMMAAGKSNGGKFGPVVVATANISLQEQLISKDLPTLQKVLPYDFKFALLKGRGNYLCVDKFDEINAIKKVVKPHEVAGALNLQPGEEAEFERIYEWAASTKTGDKSDIKDFVPAERLWSRFSINAEDCPGKDCPEHNRCHAMIAKAYAKTADVIVTNYHVLFLHMKLRQMFGKDVLLPKASVIIMDEAHKAPDIARDFFGFNISKFTFGAAVKALKKMTSVKIPNHVTGKSPENLAKFVEDEAEKFFGDLLEYHDSDDYRVRIKQPGRVRHDRLKGAVDMAVAAYLWLAKSADDRTLMASKKDVLGKRHEKTTPYQWGKRVEKFATRLDQAMRDAEAAVTMKADEPFAYSIDVKEFGREKKRMAGIIARPIRIAPYLRNSLFNQYNSVVVASATLSTGGTFEFIKGEMGIANAKCPPIYVGDDEDGNAMYEESEDTREHMECIVDSPFDYKKNCLLVIPKETMPVPKGSNDTNYLNEVALHIYQAIENAGGRTLVLFTSRKSMEWTHRVVASKVKRLGYTLLKQGDAPPTQLVEMFKQDETSVLFGLERFWAGVDVKGPSLSCVVMDKIPFLTPEDPVLDALSEQEGRDAFGKYSVPKAITQFKQGHGRLIRDVEDYGVVVMLDPRILTQKDTYGKRFLVSVPASKTSTKMEHIKHFLDEERAKRG